MDKTILALGADIKNRILIARNGSFHFGPDIGDLSKAENFEFFKTEVRKAAKKIKPDIIAYDLHPDYFSSGLARELLPQRQLLAVQHHHAHIASVLQEHRLKGPVIGVSFDGTGYGRDGNSWGGEFLLVKRRDFSRLAHLKYRMMPGGDKVVNEPWRMVLSILGEKAKPFLSAVKKNEQELVLAMLSCNINSPKSSSAGRLFDAAAALLGVCVYASSEAEGPIKLEAMCDKRIKQQYRFTVTRKNGYYVIDTDGLFLGMLRDLKQGKDRCLIASKFHNSMAEIIVAVARRLSRSLRVKNVALSGGVFQNNFLKTKVKTELSDSGLGVFTNITTPVNDLNISLGQYYVSGGSGKN